MATTADVLNSIAALQGVISAFPTQALNDAADGVAARVAALPAGADLQPLVDAVTGLQAAAQAENDAAAAVIAKLNAVAP